MNEYGMIPFLKIGVIGNDEVITVVRDVDIVDIDAFRMCLPPGLD